MNEHKIFKTPIRLVILMAIGFNYILQDLLLAVFLGISIYGAVVWVEQKFGGER